MMHADPRWYWLLLAPLLLLPGGCGYTVDVDVGGAGMRGTLVAIQPFRNLTRPVYEPGLEKLLHDELINALMTGPMVLSSADDADMIVTGEILRFQQSIQSIDTSLDPSEVRVSVQVRVNVERRRPRREHWSDLLSPTTEGFALGGGETLKATTSRAFRELARNVLDVLVHPDDRWGAKDVTARRVADLRGELQHADDIGDARESARLRDEIDRLEAGIGSAPDHPLSNN
ncbi:MAG: LPS assembly lipoprotein LptE [Planctomycetota bacterium]